MVANGEFFLITLPDGSRLVHPIAAGERHPLNFGREACYLLLSCCCMSHFWQESGHLLSDRCSVSEGDVQHESVPATQPEFLHNAHRCMCDCAGLAAEAIGSLHVLRMVNGCGTVRL